jgi:uncharacterized protein YbjT (DUF2867 family)
MNIILLGATGGTGGEVLRQALAAGDKITVVARTPSKIAIKHPDLVVIQGDATDAKVLHTAMSGNEVLISALGSPLAGSKKNNSLINSSTEAILSAAKETDLKRIIMMSSFAVIRPRLKGFAKLITGALMKNEVADKIAGETALRKSGIKWTIIYPTALTKGRKTRNVRIVPVSEKLGLGHRISRADVADWMVREAKEGRYVNQDVTITG